ncbi:hypothetical protein [Bradyrhizobium tunisiense]|uniref:hypothetical protein n=1 Tax=Bradyrhizobium tunisiense TaxID=3278709 RepID=UPI0035DD6EC9
MKKLVRFVAQIAPALKSPWTRGIFQEEQMEKICRDLAAATTDPVERAALLELAENYGQSSRS